MKALRVLAVVLLLLVVVTVGCANCPMCGWLTGSGDEAATEPVAEDAGGGGE